MSLSRQQISDALRTHQKRLQMGDKLPPLVELANRAGIHRDTLYEALRGRRISQISQTRLSMMLSALEPREIHTSKIMHIRLGPNGLSLGFGVGPVGASKQQSTPRAF